MVPGAPASRLLGELTFPDVSRWLKETSILCLPIGAFEQHGAHLPLNTDAVIAEEGTLYTQSPVG
jgi:creatinine amidohydrolase/Fe(II)-dependent formamide hydrolase-like protein